jgi:hypothetical protein
MASASAWRISSPPGERTGPHSGAGGIGGPVVGDAVPGVDVPGAGAQLQIRLIELGEV